MYRSSNLRERGRVVDTHSTSLIMALSCFNFFIVRSLYKFVASNY